MKNSVFRTREIINKDKLMDSTHLPDLISNEVADRLSNFLKIRTCETKLRILANGEISILVSINAESKG